MDALESIKNYRAKDEHEVELKKLLLFLIQEDDSIFERKNTKNHITVSAWIVNEAFDSVVMVHHNIYNSYAWCGGHADGDRDLLHVAYKEIEEETGLTNLKQYGDIISIDALPVMEHKKNNLVVSRHCHLNVTYLFQANEKDPLCIKEDENSDVAWIKIKDIEKVVQEQQMIPLYEKLNQRMLEYR